MLVSSARRPSSRRVGAVRIALVALTVALVLTGCAEEERAAPKPVASPTPIADLDASSLQVPRIEFCSLVPGSAVSDALGGGPDTEAAYGNGDEVELQDAGKDVVHELGCVWSTDEGLTARAWVFARPVSAQFARSVIASGRRTAGCRTVAGPAYGRPSATQVCARPDGEQRVRLSGLFDQTWLTCELAAPGAEQAGLRARTNRWCVEVANALDTAR